MRGYGSASAERVGAAVAGTTGLDVLFLFGSRARGDAHSGSDWDFGYLSEAGLDADGLLATLVAMVGNDRIDLVDLRRASGLLRYRVARDGHLLFERTNGVADAFRLQAADFWCDAGALLERGYDDVLAGLDR